MDENQINILLAAARAGQKKAENELFELLTARFRFIATHRIWNSEDRNEVVQAALTIVFKEYAAIEFTRSFGAWAYRVLDNQILSYIQRRRRDAGRHEELPDPDYLLASAGVDISPNLKRRLLGCLKEIGARNVAYIRALNFSYQGFSVAEICQALKITRANFYSILSRARSLLQACLEKGGKYHDR